ncbi:MAG: hypothetical protein JNM14_03090 [Ferruginibacter sp.]|nr:hypothetical protein [Ferruginibacter sp.]
MLKAPTEFVIVFILISVLLILGMVIFISMIIYRYQQRQNTYFKDIEVLKASHENTLLQSQLEIKEQTFQNISREIHDNINHKLILAKLYLNTFDFNNINKGRIQISDSVNIIGEVINDLSDLSHSMSNEALLNHGFVKALKDELIQLEKSGIYKTKLSVTGSSVFMEPGNELILFRMIQEVLNNIVKHAGSSFIKICLHQDNDLFSVHIQDNGKGFNIHETGHGTGLQNIKKRAAMMKGYVTINSSNAGTEIKIEIPKYENNTP